MKNNSNLKLQSKASTLISLKSKLGKNINIPELIKIKKIYFREKNKSLLIKKIIKKFNNQQIIIRSSAIDEDLENSSNAGRYDSFVVNSSNIKDLNNGILKVLKKLKSNNDEIIFQKYLSKPDISGVIFTKDINTNAPYYVINFDRSGKTDLVTSGKKNLSQQTLNILRNYKLIPAEFVKLINVVKKIEQVFKKDRLDIEFAIKKNKVYIFQVRNLKKNYTIDEKLFYSATVNLKKKIEKIKKINPNLSGLTTVLSNMSDWNPAEMIGAKCTNMSFSIYSELITNDVWSKQRDEYGYKNVYPNRLMIDFAGSPYIDLRTDFNSFLPKNLSKQIEKKSVNYFIDKIKSHKELHDKIEFQIIPTCFNFSLKKKIKRFLSIKETNLYYYRLKNITESLIINKNSKFYMDISKVKYLEEKLKLYRKNKSNPIQNIFFITNLCKEFGTLPFAGIARSAFIATVILRDLVKYNCITNSELNDFYGSVNTVTCKFNNNLYRLKKKKISKNIFLKNFGHLRPSTYSITSKNYRDGFDIYFSNIKDIKLKRIKKFKLNSSKEKSINELLKKNDLKFDAKKLFKFAKLAIHEREYSKYIFTKAINEIFINLKYLSRELKLNYVDLEYLSINTILQAYNNLSVSKLSSIIKSEINLNKKLFNISKEIKLPDVIVNKEDVFIHYETKTNTNFITEKNIFGKVKILTNKLMINNRINLDHFIVFIENADPGFDFIFSYKIKGLITKYGGSNSHMAIRCMELGIPAAIGVGEKKYNFYSSKNEVEINCSRKTIKVFN